MSYLLLAIVVFAWGFSWYAIILQVDAGLDAIVALAYRFVLAAAVMIGWLGLRGQLKKVPLRDHFWLAGLGACLFSLNFYCFYIAAQYLPSGLLSVVFATAAIMGVFNQWAIMRRGLDRRVLIAAPVGVIGLALLLGPEIANGEIANKWAVALPFLGTYFFSVGNLISVRLSASYDLPVTVGYGMVYGATIALAIAVFNGSAFALPADPAFWGGLIFLAIISSVLAFLTYLRLVDREGPARAAYATVLFPIVAMAVSATIEGYAWTLYSTLGLALALGGTVLVFSRPAVQKHS
jgi:drug/metabolite transporter (DMT)-like permease